MDAATFDRFLVLLDQYWGSNLRWAKTASELHEWRVAEARRTGNQGQPLRRFTRKNLSNL
jgi:hypothetical protein